MKSTQCPFNSHIIRKMISKEDRVRVHFTLDSGVLERLKLTAKRKGSYMSDLVNDALRKHLPEVWNELDKEEQTFQSKSDENS